jgi:hypothetical protein
VKLPNDKWEQFDRLAGDAYMCFVEWDMFNAEKMRQHGNKITDPGRISGNVWPNWPDGDRKRNRELLALFYDAQDKALKAKPPRVHMKTARARLRSFLEA